MTSLNRRQFALGTVASGGLLPSAAAAPAISAKAVLPGIWQITVGTPEPITPVRTRRVPPSGDRISRLPHVPACPVEVERITARATRRGYLISIPLARGELVYGFGLQLQSFQQRGLKKKLRVNADPKMDTGDSHAPVPFYVTSRGYGVLVDTARYATFICGNKQKKADRRGPERSAATELARDHADEPSEMLIDIPAAGGADVYIFSGPDMLAAVQRYNLFSGGGALPPRWGLGFWYRCDQKFDQAQVLAMADEFRSRKIPCDVLGLEPGWQTHAYSCSYVWSDKFPDPSKMLAGLKAAGFHLNLWEHAFTHPSSPIYDKLLPFSGEYKVWGGLAPDFLSPDARRIFAEFHEREHVSRGVSGYKLDECDNSDFTGNWSFPECSRYPSGADGEQMHSLFGLRYQDAVESIFDRRAIRTWGLARSSQALAAPYPYVLYSDLYDHSEFIRGMANAGFSGLLWCPEVRDARDGEDLIRRLETVIFSPLAMINAWYIANPPWKQFDAKRNNAGEFLPGWESLEAKCRALIELRMRLIPYFYSAFAQYHLEGIPPFRALVMDYPADRETWTADDQYMAGDSLLVAPVTSGVEERSVYLPEGEWFHLWTGQKFAGRQRTKIAAPIGQIPVFVKSGAVLPLGGAAPYAEHEENYAISAHIFGDGRRGAVLYEDGGAPSAEFTKVNLHWDAGAQSGRLERQGAARGSSYTVTQWLAGSASVIR